MKVTLVLDPSCGEVLAALDQPLWVCDSPVNRPVAERLWSVPNIDRMAVTTFKMSSESLGESGADIIPTIDEHHPQWTEVVIVGACLTPSLRATFEQYRPGRFVEIETGFTFVREASS
jgi:hypothetical protein